MSFVGNTTWALDNNVKATEFNSLAMGKARGFHADETSRLQVKGANQRKHDSEPVERRLDGPNVTIPQPKIVKRADCEDLVDRLGAYASGAGLP